ncbi:MAG TPA: hypothetical protein VMF91_20550 [Bryobacteraceae bacterium]|nr:hypothetical protein [Bryobacteraceae bacterium]
MRAFLMYNDRSFDLKTGLPPNQAELTQDLELNTLFTAMAGDDKFLLDVVTRSVLSSLQDSETILYRQAVLADCMGQPKVIRALYQIAVDSIERQNKVWSWDSPDSILRRSVEVLGIFAESLKKLRQISERYGGEFRSDGFTRLFTMLAAELDDGYMALVEEHLAQLKFRHGILMSAELGKGNKGTDYVLCKLVSTEETWAQRIQNWVHELTHRNTSSYYFEIADRDQAGAEALSELKAYGIAHIATALAQATDHILNFFTMLRTELAFYIGCLNLQEALAKKGEPICFPQPSRSDDTMLCCRELYDACLALTVNDRVVGNEINADGKRLIMITGANRGGKSTFLRSIGLAHLMMQCGMFVPATYFGASVCSALFTHFKREEDATMRSGKLDEELSRMSTIIDRVRPSSMVLLNEAFASTNEREGSEIARQIVQALLDSDVKVLYVTHLFDLAHGLHVRHLDDALFLRAERLIDGQRTFRLIEGEPLATSYGGDLYRRIFTGAPDAAELPAPQ